MVFIFYFTPMKVIFLTFAIGFLVFFARFPQPIITPTIYAEDGVWIGSAISNGWVYTFLHARPDYFVFFNIFFLYIASILSKIFSGSVLMLLPLFIALLSYAFYAFTSVMVFLTVKKLANIPMAILAYVMSVLIPLGTSQAESLGTLVQIGFYMPVLSICFHLLRDEILSLVKKSACDVIIFLMAATNPVNFVVTGVYVVIKLFTESDKKKFLFSILPLLVFLLALFVAIVPRMNGNGGIIGSYNPDHVIEMVTARSIIYPFLFPFYKQLNNFTSIILTLAYFLLVLIAFFRAKNNVRSAIVLMAVILIIYDIATTAGRSGITGLLSGYNSTYPDRYFMGINIIAIMLFTICIAQLSRGVFDYIAIAGMFYIYISGLNSMFESNQDKRRIALDYVYTNALCNAKDEGNGFSRIEILPTKDWYIRVPSGYVKSIGCVHD
jgi:hypothetical protein